MKGKKYKITAWMKVDCDLIPLQAEFVDEVGKSNDDLFDDGKKLLLEQVPRNTRIMHSLDNIVLWKPARFGPHYVEALKY